MLPLPGHPTAGVCCSGGDARKLSGQSLRKQGLEQSRAWWQMTVLGPTLALPSAGLPAAACGGRSLPLGRRLLPAPLPREKFHWPRSLLCPSRGSAALLKAGL